MLLFGYAFGAVAAGLGLTAILEGFTNRRRETVLLLILLLLLVELRPQPWLAGDSIRILEPLQMSDAYPMLAGETDRGAVVEWPSDKAKGGRDEFAMSLYAYGSAGHLRNVLAYKGSIRLPEVDSLQAAAGRLPNEERRQRLWRAGVSRLVLHRPARPGESERRITSLRDAGYRVLHEGLESVVFSLAPPDR